MTATSPVARRAPGTGAWGHEPLTGAQVRLLALTPTRVAVLDLDRDVGGPYLYRVTQVEIEARREEVRGVRVGPLRPNRGLTVVLRDAEPWRLEVSARGRRHWQPFVDALGAVDATSPASDAVASDATVVSPDSRA